MLSLYHGDTGGLCVNDNHSVYRWNNKDCKILISMTRHGNGMSCHFSSDKKGLRLVKNAIIDGMDYIFKKFDWCEMIFANIDTPSVERLVKKIGFSHVANSDSGRIFIKVKGNDKYNK